MQRLVDLQGQVDKIDGISGNAVDPVEAVDRVAGPHQIQLLPLQKHGDLGLAIVVEADVDER